MSSATEAPEAESLNIQFEQEPDGRWLADIPELPGIMAYGRTKDDARVNVIVLTLRVIAERTEESRKAPQSILFK